MIILKTFLLAGLTLGISCCDSAESPVFDFQQNAQRDLIDDNIEFVNLNQKYRELSHVAYEEVTSVLDSEGINRSGCQTSSSVRVKVIVKSHAEINKMREQGIWGFALADAGTISGFFEWSQSEKGNNRMYLAHNGTKPLDELFIHEYTHAYFLANCILENNNLLPAQEEVYAEIIRKNYITK